MYEEKRPSQFAEVCSAPYLCSVIKLKTQNTDLFY